MEFSQVGSQNGKLRNSIEESCSPESHCKIYKSLRTGGGLHSKGISNFNSTFNAYNNLQRKDGCINIANSEFNEDIIPVNCYYASDEKDPYRNMVGSPIITISAQKQYSQMMNYFNPELKVRQFALDNRPSTSDNNKLNKRGNFDYKIQRPSTSKPFKYESHLRRVRTRMLSQKEYNQLQSSEKKSIKEAKRTLDKPISQYSGYAQRVSLRSEKKQNFIDRNVQIKVFDENESFEASRNQEEDVDEECQSDPNQVEDLKAPIIKKHHVRKRKIKDVDQVIKEFREDTSFEDPRERAHFKNGAEAIFLRVYDVSQGIPLNRFLECFGFGIYHTSIQIYGHEYYYGGHESEITGVVETDIGKSTTLHLKEIILSGFTYYDPDDVDLLLDEFGKYWQGILYDPFNHNCNDFSKAVIKHLCHEENKFQFPNYINRFSKLSSVLRVWFNPLKILFGDIVNAPEEKEEEERGLNDIEECKEESENENEKETFSERIQKCIDRARVDIINSNSYYITGYYENAKNCNKCILENIEDFDNNIEEIRSIRITAMENMIKCCHKLNQIEEMIDYCGMCIDLDSNNSKYYLKRGLAYAYNQKDYASAYSDLCRAHDLDPNDNIITNEKSLIYELINK